jgi:hypothetical protein
MKVHGQGVKAVGKKIALTWFNLSRAIFLSMSFNE